MAEATQPSNRASSSSTRRSRSGSSGRSGSGGPRRRLHRRTSEDDGDHPCDERAERKQPGEEPEAALRRRREHARAELGDQCVLDLLLGVPRGDPRADERLHPLGDRSIRLVERRLAHGADELGLEVGGVRWSSRSSAGGESERGDKCDEKRSHVASARSTAARRRARSSSAVMPPTKTSSTLPSRSITNVSGNPVTP